MKVITKFLLGAAGVAALAALVKTAHPPSRPLAGQTALITGGSSGLGYILARELARPGCRLVIHGLFPGVTADLLGLVAALLLPAVQPGARTARSGRVIRSELEPTHARVLQVLTTLGQQAVERYQPALALNRS